MSFKHNFLNFRIQEGASLPGLDSAHLRASDCVWLFPRHLSHVTLLNTGNSRPEAYSTAAGSKVSGLLGSHFLVPLSDAQPWGWVGVPTADGTLPLSKAVYFESGIPCLHWLWGGWGTLLLEEPVGIQRGDGGVSMCQLIFRAVQGWIPPFFFFFFLQGFGFEEKILVLKGFLKTQEYHNFSDNIFCYF